MNLHLPIRFSDRNQDGSVRRKSARETSVAIHNNFETQTLFARHPGWPADFEMGHLVLWREGKGDFRQKIEASAIMMLPEEMTI